jgi:hypothetical protein
MKNIRKILVIIVTLVTITINGLANALPLNGQNTGEISDRFKVLFVPAGYVFSIWGVIYLGLIAYAIFQALPAQRDNQRLHSAAWWFVLAGIANSAWIFLWHYNLFPLTLLAMFTLLVSLIAIYLKLGIGRVSVSAGERWATFIPISIYLGWISVATIANTSILLYSWGLSSLSADVQAWLTVMMLTIGAVLAILMAFLRRDVAFILVLSWAYLGVAVPAGQDHPLVSGVAYLLAAVLAILAIVTAFWKRK